MEKEEQKITKSDFALKEEQVLDFWRQNKIFKKSVEKEAPRGNYVFYEGPPTANGVPGIHHVLARSFKDVMPRFKTMQGFRVERKAGWDTHGLPVELQVEKELQISGKPDIEKYGVEEFNKMCKTSVWRFKDEWEKLTERIAFWVDMEDPYVTYSNDYIESLWWVTKQISDKNLIYKGHKVVPHCPRCGTALSSHEVAQGYKLVKENSVYLSFKVTKGNDQVFVGDNILAWTTTPWTLPGNVALAVGPKIIYVKVKIGEQNYILAKERLSILTGEYELISEFIGQEMVGVEYQPLFEIEAIKNSDQKAYFVTEADFVTTQDGTGVVHTAVMYGEDDYNLGDKINLPKVHTVDEAGKFIIDLAKYNLAGRFVKNKETEKIVLEYLQANNFLFKEEFYEHDYPFCWRCDTPLLYYAKDSYFIKVTAVKEQLIANNQKINWIPEHIKEGRFGEWLNNIKDWAISRERYWGTPLPIWECGSCQATKTVGSIAELQEVGKVKNNFLIMRHGGAESNISGIFSSGNFNGHHLTEEGKEQVRLSAEKLKEKKIDLIFASDYTRTKETAEIVADIIDFPKENIIFDQRLWEVNAGIFSGKPVAEYDNYFSVYEERFFKTVPEGENHTDIRKRMLEFLFEINKKYAGKNILIISHGDPIWVMLAGVKGLDPKKASLIRSEIYLNTGDFKEFNFIPFPHNQNYELDLHKPYIDEFKFSCACGGEMKRTPEVFDCWFDSGAMPFAQNHYPFENKELIDEGKQFPADYICEAIDQTRGWFYTLLAISTLLDKGNSYKNVICLGHINDKNGKKMSKSKGNVINPWEVINSFGVDAVRQHMYTLNQPGEGKKYDLNDVRDVFRKNIMILWNVYKFYEMYSNDPVARERRGEVASLNQTQNIFDPQSLGSKNILDKWLNIRFQMLLNKVTEELEKYHIYEAAKEIPVFIDDFSTWYLRRSRDRFKGDNEEDKISAILMTKKILSELAKVMAPFMPFISETIWQNVSGLNFNDINHSVHLEKWSEIKEITKEENEILEKMVEVRKIISFGLEARSLAGIKIRQPLQKIKIQKSKFKIIETDYLDLIKDELNLKEVELIDNLEKEVELDTEITEALKQEGIYRDFVRFVQDLRKKKNLTPNQEIILSVKTNELGQKILNDYMVQVKKTGALKELNFKDIEEGNELKIDELSFMVSLE